MATLTRSIFKTITWRFTATFTTFIISWIVTGSFALGIGIATIEFWIKLVLYFIHERLWNSTQWGVK